MSKRYEYRTMNFRSFQLVAEALTVADAIPEEMRAGLPRTREVANEAEQAMFMHFLVHSFRIHSVVAPNDDRYGTVIFERELDAEVIAELIHLNESVEKVQSLGNLAIPKGGSRKMDEATESASKPGPNDLLATVDDADFDDCVNTGYRWQLYGDGRVVATYNSRWQGSTDGTRYTTEAGWVSLAGLEESDPDNCAEALLTTAISAALDVGRG